jgi:DNA-binding NarL/FixJ family response regulator
LEKLRVLVAEDHESVRRILVTLLSAEFEVVDAVGNGEELVNSAILLRPDVIVSDLLMPGQDAFLARKELIASGIDVPFVFITLLDAGLISPLPESISYVHKSDVTAELIESVWAVARGEIYLSRSFRELWG